MPEDIAQLSNLQLEYNRCFPEVSIIPGEVYCSPGFEDGKNIFCAFDSHNKLVGFAPIFPVPVLEDSSFDSIPHIFWTNILVDTKSPGSSSIKESLLEKITKRAMEIKETLPKRKTKLCFNFFSTEQPSIDFVLSKGFTHSESIYKMSRCLHEPIPLLYSPKNIAIRKWKMITEEEQDTYIQSYNEAFPEKPSNIAELKYFMAFDLWANGTTISAFIHDKLIGSVMVYWDENRNLNSDIKNAFSEQIFVIPKFRGRGIASYLIRQALIYLMEKGMDEVHLEVKANNSNALKIYNNLGYKVKNEQLIHEKFV